MISKRDAFMKTRSELLKSLALAILLAVGAGVAWGCLVGWGASILSDLVSSGGSHEDLCFLRDGTPLVSSYEGHNYQGRKFRTLDGKAIEVESDSLANGDQLNGPEYLGTSFTAVQWRDRVHCIYNDYSRSEIWYFIHDGQKHGHAFLAGYDKGTRSKIGYIGTGGFCADEPPLEEQFPVDASRVVGLYSYGGALMINMYYDRVHDLGYLLCDDGLRRIRLKARSVAVVQRGDNFVSTAVSIRLRRSAESPATWDGTSNLLLRTPDRILVLDRDGKQTASYLLPPELRQLDLQVFQVKENQLLARVTYVGNDLFWLDPGGKVARREHFDLHERPDYRLPETAIVTAAMPSPATIAGVLFCYPWGPANCRVSWAYSDALRMAFAKNWPLLLTTGIVGAVLAVVCYRRQRNYGRGWTGVWTIFVLLFGLPAFFGYLAHRAWPARLPCPHCGQPAPRDRPACIACDREFPPPAQKGIEVFA
jgi:hypothetical protein